MVSKFKLDNSKSAAATQQAITRSLEIVNNYAGELSIEVLPLDRIELDPENSRALILTIHDAIHGIDDNDPDYQQKKQDWKSLETLAKTIRDDQLINPIYVYRYGNKCRLIAGERRTLASAIAGKKEIIARIATQRPVGTKLRVLQWIENNERSDLILFERIACLESIIESYFEENKLARDSSRITAKILSDLTGISMTQARRYLLILQAKPEIKAAVMSGKLENIKLVELLCSISNASDQAQLLKMALSGATFEEIIKLKENLAQNIALTVTESLGRKKNKLSLGKVKPNIAKMIVDALILSNMLEAKASQQVITISESIQWENFDSAERAFRKIMSLVEQGAHAKP